MKILNKSPMSRFSAMLHIHVGVLEEQQPVIAKQEAIAKASRLLWENVRYPESWHYRGVTDPYDIQEDELDD